MRNINDENTQNIRRKKLKLILDKYFFSITALAEKIGINRANLSAIISGAKPITSYTSNKIESMLSLPTGYLSSDDINDFEYSDYIDIPYQVDLNQVMNPFIQQSLKMPKQLLKKVNLEGAYDLFITAMPDDFMNPTIKKDELIIINKLDDTIQDSGIYLFEYLGMFKIRRLQLIGKNLMSINADNENIKYKPLELTLSEFVIIGRVIYNLSEHT